MRTNSFIKKLVVLGTVGSLLAPYCFYPKLQAAERFEIHFDGMSIPISIKELIDWSYGEEEENSELASWLNLLGFKERQGLAKFLNTPLKSLITATFALLRGVLLPGAPDPVCKINLS